MKPADAASLLGVSSSALRKWGSDEFKEYMSPTGRGGDGRYRDFTEVDLRVLYLISEMKKASKPVEEIHVLLRGLQANDWQRLPSLPQRALGSVDPQRNAIDTELYHKQLAVYIEQIDDLQKQLDDARKAYEARERETTRDREALLREIADRERKLGAMETELELWRKGRLKPE